MSGDDSKGQDVEIDEECRIAKLGRDLWAVTASQLVCRMQRSQRTAEYNIGSQSCHPDLGAAHGSVANELPKLHGHRVSCCVCTCDLGGRDRTKM